MENPQAASRKLTYRDYLLFPEDGKRHEILDGEHFVTAVPYLRHQAVVGELHLWIRFFLGPNRLGRIFVAPVDVLLSEHDVVQPDLLFISNERLAILKEKNVQGAPDLVIEVRSAPTRRRDEGLKLERYERLGVRECWGRRSLPERGEGLPPRGRSPPQGGGARGRCRRPADDAADAGAGDPAR